MGSQRCLGKEAKSVVACARPWSPALQPIWEECGLEVVVTTVSSRPSLRIPPHKSCCSHDDEDLASWSTYTDISKGGVSYRSIRSSHRRSPLIITRRSLSISLASGMAFFLLMKFFMPFCSHSLCTSSLQAQLPGTYHVDPTDLYMDLPRRLQVPRRQQAAHKLSNKHVPMLIPRLIHQATSSALPKALGALEGSWQRHNGYGWQYRLYDEAARMALVRHELPEYLKAYQALPSDAGRIEFFRYMVVLKYGGVYADVGVECNKDLDSVVKPADTMLLGWQAEEPSSARALERGLVRQRQLVNWFFAAAPGHPALREICDVISSTWAAPTTAGEPLEQAGPGIWTDIVLRHAIQQQVAAQISSRPWSVRVLPAASFALPDSAGSLKKSEAIATNRHPGLQARRSWSDCRSFLCLKYWLLERVSSARSAQHAQFQRKEASGSPGVLLHPVSVDFEPGFTMLVDQVGHGDTQWGQDVCSVITWWGVWPSALEPPTRRPAASEALIGSLGSRASRSCLVDIGAAQGLFSLAAAARGHRAIAFEASAGSLASLRASVRHNALDALVDVIAVPLGAKAGELACLRRSGTAGRADAADVELRRGYGDPAVHSLAGSDACELAVRRKTLPEALGEAGHGDIGALRLSANGWEGWIVDGALQWLQAHPPGVILLELVPEMVRRSGYGDPSRLLRVLYGLGYTHMAHAGQVCDDRWRNLTWALDHQLALPGSVQGGERTLSATVGGQLGAAGAAGETLQGSSKSTWCRLKPDGFEMLVSHAVGGLPENVLLIHGTHQSVAVGGGNVSMS